MKVSHACLVPGEVVARFQTLTLSRGLATLVRVCERSARFGVSPDTT